MENQVLKIFKTNIEGVAVNRGFYFQYLLTLKKWIKNYINEEDVDTLIEVDNDIKEIGDKLIFTQVKCYTAAFSLNSSEVKKTLFDFFMLFLECREENEDIEFCFSTNTSVAKSEKLLSQWIVDNQLQDVALKSAVNKKISTLLIKEVNDRKKHKLGLKLNIAEKQEIKSASETLKEKISNLYTEFTKCIRWEFLNFSPEEAIKEVRIQIETLLDHEKFGARPLSILFSVLISEIYRCSQNTLKENRTVNNEILKKLLENNDDELRQFINTKLTVLLKIQFEVLRDEISHIKREQEFHSEEIKVLKNSVSMVMKKELPQNLTLGPDCFTSDILGWEDFCEEVHNTIVSRKIVSVYAEGGMGKTAFTKKYFRTYNTYNHTIWINVEQSIIQSFLFDEILIKNLEITFAINQDFQTQFKFLINELNKIMGTNLIVIDIQTADDEAIAIRELAALTNWEKLILTRNHYQNIKALKLPKINFMHAKEIYLQNSSADVTDTVLSEFFEFINFNPLVIELTAKTIKNSINLTLAFFMQSLKDQKLDSNEFNIDIEINEEDKPIKIFSYLLHKFNFPYLKNEERYYLDYLALLPSNNIIIEELIMINGKEFYDENVVTICNIINALEKKGLVTYNTDRTIISMHKIIQEIVIYNERSQLNPFIGNMAYIVWLTARIIESYNEPSKSLRFLKYAESILNAIKENYRKSLYQPLLVLENELLFSYKFFINTENELNKWVDLASRAEKYLAPSDKNLGIIYNNLALAYVQNEERIKGMLYLEKALGIFKMHKPDMLTQIITISNNISNIHLKNKDLHGALLVFQDVKKLRKMHNVYDDQQLSIEYRILAESYKIAGDYPKAITLLREGITFHRSLKSANRNDFYLSAYFNQLSNLFLLQDDLENAISAQETAVHILEDMQMHNSESLILMYRVLLHLYQHNEKKDKEQIVLDKINSFKKFELC